MTGATVDIAALTCPFAGELRAGLDLRYDAGALAVYHELRDARAAARSAERRAAYGDGENSADRSAALQAWRQVADQASRVLAQYSKDLEVAAWLSEALLRLHGFAGLRDGFGVIAGLVEAVWDDLHPMPDEDGLQRRLVAIAGLNGEGGEGTLIAPIRMVPLVDCVAGSVTLWHYERAARMERLTPAAREAALADAGFSLETIAAGAHASSMDERLDLVGSLQEAADAVAAADAALDRAAGDHAPSLRQIRTVLDQVKDALGHLGFSEVPGFCEVPGLGEMPGFGEASAALDGDEAVASAGPSRQGYASRDAAIAAIMALAVYWRHIEPHSPISYTLEEAVRRARLSLPELLAELIPDRDARRQYLVSAGISQRDGDDE